MFSDLGLNEALVSTLQELGYEQPTPVQQLAIPAGLTGRDLLVSSQTGSGKTAAFLLPCMQRMMDHPKPKDGAARVLILTPTRELAQQVEKAARRYGRDVKKLNTACLVGGSSYHLQLKDLGRKPEVLICTPGRLIDHLERGRVDLSQVETLVLDEADRMLDMGFADDIDAIVGQLPEERQTLLFSATLDGVVGHLAQRLTRSPERIEIEKAPEQEGNIEQRLLIADNLEHKHRLLDAVLRDVAVQQAVVFTATKRGAEELSEQLREEGFSVEALHGDMPQRARNSTLLKLRQGRVNILIATDVAARGIDIAGISHVINFDTPRQVEDYVHRIGRTGRAGRTGTAITLAEARDRRIIRDIERYTGQLLERHVIPGLEPTRREEVRGEPKRRYGQSRTGGGGGRFKNGHRGNGPAQEFQNERPAREKRPYNAERQRPRPERHQEAAPAREVIAREDASHDMDERQPNFDVVPVVNDYSGRPARKPRAAKPRFDDRQPRFDNRQPRFEDRQPRFEDRQPRFDDRQPRFEDRQPRFDDRQPRFEDRQPRFDDRQPRFDDRQPRFDSAPRPGKGRKKPEHAQRDRQPTEEFGGYRDPGENFLYRQIASDGQGKAAAGHKKPGGGQGKAAAGKYSRGGPSGPFKRDGQGAGKPRTGGRGGFRQRDGFGARDGGFGAQRRDEVYMPEKARPTPKIIKAEKPARTVYHNDQYVPRTPVTDGETPPRKRLTLNRPSA